MADMAIACVRVIDMLPGVNYQEWKREKCADCGALIIVSLPGVIYQKEHPGSRYICMVCAIASGQAPSGAVPGAIDLVEQQLGKKDADRAVEVMVKVGELIEEAGRQGRSHDLAGAWDDAHADLRKKKPSA